VFVSGVGRSNVFLISAGYAGGLATFPWLPGPYFGSDQSLVTKAAIAFLIPTAALVTSAAINTVFIRTTSTAPHLESIKALRAVSASTVLFMVGLHALVLVSLLGFTTPLVPAHRLTVVLFGLLLIAIGNVLPRVRPNTAIGIRTHSLLEDPAAWTRVHRAAGYFLVALGAVAVGVGLVLSKSQIPLVLGASVLVGAIVNLAAYRRWTRG
jgi:uncharacterized membrane protein